jgi:hypothetical protein
MMNEVGNRGCSVERCGRGGLMKNETKPPQGTGRQAT